MNIARALQIGWRPPLVATTAAVLIGLTAAWYGWLDIPDSTGLYLTVQAVIAICLWLAAAGFYAGLVHLFSVRMRGNGAAGLSKLWLPGVRLWLATALMLVLLAIVLFFIGWLEDQCLRVVWKIPSWLTWRLNYPVRIPPFVKAVQIIFAFVLWGVLPALATMILTAWYRGYGVWPGWRIAHSRRIWIATALILIMLEYLPWRLAHWVPEMNSGLGELFSAAARIGAAGILAVLGWLLLLPLWVGAVESQAAEPGESRPVQ